MYIQHKKSKYSQTSWFRRNNVSYFLSGTFITFIMIIISNGPWSSVRSACTVRPIGWRFSKRPIAAQCGRGRGGKIMKLLGKSKQNFLTTFHLPFREWRARREEEARNRHKQDDDDVKQPNQTHQSKSVRILSARSCGFLFLAGGFTTND